MDNIIGVPVEGANFYGREAEVLKIWRHLDGGNNLMLLGPRRVGKTSLLRHLRATAIDHGFTAVEVSLADITEEIEFVKRLYAEIEKHPAGKQAVKAVVGGPLKKFFKTAGKFSFGSFAYEWEASATDSWTEVGEALSESLGQNGATKWLFLLDEVSVFVQSLIEHDPTGQRARKFLNWMRELRIGHRAPKKNRWFITGSIGLPTITRRVALGDTINDLKEYVDFGAYPRDVAVRFLRELANSNGVTLSDEVVGEILDRVGWLIPFFLHRVFSELRDQNPPITQASVDAAIEGMVKSGQGNAFTFWEERIRKQLKSPDDKYALAVLEPIAKDPNGAIRQTIDQALANHVQDEEQRKDRLRFLLSMLEADGYIVLDGDRYRFLSPLLAAYWRRFVL